MVLWVDKHRPNRIDGLDFHDDLSNRLGALAQNADSMPHLLFHGPSGAGKRTRISCLLREIYGPGASKLKVESKIFKHDTKSIEINLISSNYHIELSPGDAGNSDCFVVQDVIKEIAQTHTLGGNTQKAFKIVVLNETDQLTKNAQQALRRTMEKYVSTYVCFWCKRIL